MAGKDDANKEQKKILKDEIRKTAKVKVVHTHIRVAGVRRDMKKRDAKAEYAKGWYEKNKQKGKEK